MTMGKMIFTGLLLSCAAAPCSAALPLLNATCPGGKQVHVDQGGPVFINGKQAKLKRVNNSYYEAVGAGITLSISINPDGSATMSWTGRGRANGICTVKED